MRTRWEGLMLVVACLAVGTAPAAAAVWSDATPASVASAATNGLAPSVSDPADALFDGLRLEGIITRDAFASAYQSVSSRGLAVGGGTLAIADMSLPSTEKRLVIVDLARQQVLLRTWVAHGEGSGGLMAERFSNAHGSHQTSLGLYRVGIEFVSPQHGAALLLQGLDKGINDQARAREVIVHGADYVSADFIARTGRLGRSWGCPAVPRADMARVIATLKNGGLLFVHGG